MQLIDDQPIAATFFGEGVWLTDFITPTSIDIQTLYRKLTDNFRTNYDKIVACWDYVSNEIRYVHYVKGKLFVENKVSIQEDLWNSPAITSKVKVGNCANKAFLLTSLLRNTLPSSEVYCVLGNLYNGKPSGHAWVQVNMDGRNFILESTRNDVPIVPVDVAPRYEAIHLFNDKEIYAIPGKTLMMPFAACYSTWLKDYLDWVYIEGGK